MNVAILEDEMEMASQVSLYVQRFCKDNDIPVNISVFHNGFDLLECNNLDYEIFLLDIQLPVMNGMDVGLKIRQVNKTAVIMFITNSVEYAIQGYSVGALDYILKPISYDSFAFRFKNACEVIKKTIGKKIVISVDGKTIVLDSNDILYFEIMDHNIVVHMPNETFNIYGTLKEIESKLDDARFARCNSCYLVNLLKIQRIENDLVIVNNNSLKISKSKRKDFLNSFRRRFL